MHNDPDTIRRLAQIRHEELLAAAAGHRLAARARGCPKPVVRAAVTDMAPVVLGVFPLGMVVGVAAHEASLAAGSGLLTSFLMYGGVANLTALTLAGSGAGVLAVLLAVLIVNARFAVYGASLEPRFRNQPAWFRWLAPHTIVDQTYAVATGRDDLDDDASFRRWWIAAGAVLGAGWCGAVAAGIVLGPVLPADSPLAIAAPACLVALLVPRLRELPGAAAAATAGVVAAVAAGLPHHAGLPMAVVAGLVAGAATDRVEVRR
ncbi:MAG TPA: AzlC family ABC transporter permease [Pseudonocardia sp.]|nr:AzlC family ABC transporter permease [Pseudonocardia sp.]